MNPIELDNNATTRPLPEVVAAMSAALAETWHNPSSVHRGGQAARHAVELARQAVASLLCVRAREVTFTGSGTESIDLAIRGRLLATGKPVIVTDDLEHAAVRDLAGDLAKEGVTVRTLPVDRFGAVDAEALPALLKQGDVGVVSVQWANNETGVVQPIERIHELCKAARVSLHCDATQWVGKALMPSDGPPCDLLTCSPHKWHGPKGVGVLWTRRGIGLRPRVLGSQELGRRGGTENVAGIVGAGVAAQHAEAWVKDITNRDRLTLQRDRFESAVLAGCTEARINGHEVGDPASPERLVNTTNIGFASLEAEALLMLLSERGVYASAGAACSSGSLDPSPVLLAMGVEPRYAHGSVRFSLSRFTTDDDIELGAEAVIACVQRLAGSSAATANASRSM